MRRTFIILALATLSAHAVDCIRATFNYFATSFEDHALVMAGEMLPDSLYQEQNGLIYTIKYHWTGTHLDSMGLYQSCHARNIEKKSTYIPDWEIDSTKVGNVKKYDWKSQKEKRMALHGLPCKGFRLYRYRQGTTPDILHQERDHPRSQQLDSYAQDHLSRSE